MIKVEEFEVSAQKHEQDATDGTLAWKVFVCVRFASEDPKDWGELRAFGGSWTRSINRSKSSPKKKEHRSQLVASQDLMLKQAGVKIVQQASKLPEWGHGQGPLRGINSHSLRLGNDQHMEIFYKQTVPNVRRSDPKAQVPVEHPLMDYNPVIDTNECDNIMEAERKEEIDLSKWHIVGRDEPAAGSFKQNEYVEYWHQAEFQICDPSSFDVIAWRRLFLRVQGMAPHRYLQPIIT